MEFAGRRLHVLLCVPDDGRWPSDWVLHLPAFADEMNKSRKLVADQTRELVSKGYGVLIPDYSATGDSEGEFEAADWGQWKAEALAILNWIVESGANSVGLWGVRLGALMALEVYAQLGQVDVIRQRVINRLVLWQPVLDGKQFMTQFLRIRVAASAIASDGDSSQKDTVASLRERLAQGESLEVGGYCLNPGLVSSIDSLSSKTLPPPAGASVQVFEVSSVADSPVMPVTARVAQMWRDQSCSVEVKKVQGEPFWAAQELVEAQQLIEQSTHLWPKVTDAAIAGAVTPSASGALDCQGEQTLTFGCDSSELHGILHVPDSPTARAVVVVVGGPQYRVGSHRYFVTLARALAAQGVTVLRFDYRGMGDSEGPFTGFEALEHDIQSAIDTLVNRVPAVQEVTLWGLCDGATASGFYAYSDSRVTGLILLNPWVRSEAGEAKAQIKHYYLQRLMQRDFWRKLYSGSFNAKQSLSSLVATVRKVFSKPQVYDGIAINSQDLLGSLQQSLDRFTGRTLFILSGNDLTAAEFSDGAKGSAVMQAFIQRESVSVEHLPSSDHTFSRNAWKQRATALACDWINRP